MAARWSESARREARWTVLAVLVALSMPSARAAGPPYDPSEYVAGREALVRGDVEGAVSAFCSMLRPEAGKPLYTVSVVLLCRRENLRGEFSKLTTVAPVFVQEVPYKGQMCYRVCAGLSSSKGDLGAVLERLSPEALALHPFVTSVAWPCGPPSRGNGDRAAAEAREGAPVAAQAAEMGSGAQTPSSVPSPDRSTPPPTPSPAAGESPAASSEAWFRKGLAAYAQGRREEAEACYRKSLQAAPGRPEVLNNLGVLCLEDRRLEEARGLFQEALGRAPAYGRARLNLAGALWGLGREAEALEEALRAAELDPKDLAAHLTLASFYLARGEKVEALAEAEKVLALDPSNERAQVFAAAARMEEDHQ
ncbi:MAG: tetratricopeptide repeat protein [Acidobacteriota bacterium]